jgi:hypothetical protein
MSPILIDLCVGHLTLAYALRGVGEDTLVDHDQCFDDVVGLIDDLVIN